MRPEFERSLHWGPVDLTKRRHLSQQGWYRLLRPVSPSGHAAALMMARFVSANLNHLYELAGAGANEMVIEIRWSEVVLGAELRICLSRNRDLDGGLVDPADTLRYGGVPSDEPPGLDDPVGLRELEITGLA